MHTKRKIASRQFVKNNRKKQYCEGGLRMINLKAFIDSMKLTLSGKVIYRTVIGNLS